MDKMSSGFPSDVRRLLGLNPVIHGGSWRQHVGCLQTEAAAAALGSVDVYPPSEEVWLAGRWRSNTRTDTRTKAERVDNVTEHNSLY